MKTNRPTAHIINDY